MDNEELIEVANGLFAYDGGATDSGFKDEYLRVQFLSRIKSFDETKLRQFIEQYFITFGISADSEDAEAFEDWLEGYGIMVAEA